MNGKINYVRLLRLKVAESTIHQNKDLQNIDKINYLRNQLRGQASEMLMCIKVTNDNYDTAKALLKERYGKKQVMIDSDQ